MRGALPVPTRMTTLVCVLFLLWVAALVSQSRIPFQVGASEDQIARRLSIMHATLEKHHSLFGEYPTTGGGWVLVGDGSTESEGLRQFPSMLASAPAFSDPLKAPLVSIIYASNGKDYKLLAHLADKAICVETHKKKPSLVDPARRGYVAGFLRGPSWKVGADEESLAEDLLKQGGDAHPRVDKGLNRYLWGTCWAFGFWTPGAVSW